MQIELEQEPDFDGLKDKTISAGKQGVRRGLIRMQNEAAQEIREKRFNTGHLVQSLHHDIDDSGTVITGHMAPEAPYAPFVEFDTRPHIAPFAPFITWAVTKGFRGTGKSFSRGSANNLAVARAGWVGVRKHGTKGIHFMENAYDLEKEAAKEDVSTKVGEVFE
jgi:hypothetical protein